MTPDARFSTARYYDLQDNPTDDIDFYRERVTAHSCVLELGCGTGRVLLPLMESVGFIYGIDSSPAMLDTCRIKLGKLRTPRSKAVLAERDITDFDIGERFDLIIAPFRVFQNLETDAQVDGLFTCIRRHLTLNGTAIINTFRPKSGPADLMAKWSEVSEELESDIELPEGGRLKKYCRRGRFQESPLVLYPDLIYRLYGEDGRLDDESELKIPMRCWYPDELLSVVETHGFHVVNRWGGYTGEDWGSGPELVVEFGQEG